MDPNQPAGGQVPQQPAPVLPQQPAPVAAQPPVAALQAEPIAQPTPAAPVAAQPAVYTAEPVEPTEPILEPAEQGSIQWQSPEYLQDRRSPWWFVGFWIITIVLMIIALLLIKSWSFAILIPAMAASLTIYSHRPPRIVTYVLTSKGIYINERLHSIVSFKSFGVSREESLPSIVLIPTKRFRPAVTIYFPLEVGEQLVDTLGTRIPMQEVKLDFFDQLIKQLRL